ncbi:MAG: M56 family metallopeptidase [Lachnospiraceae bacterium]|nr:M56 family metallopeptidase [Lachnospiraceae bacterium]
MPMISSLFITFFRISITTGVLILLLYGLGSLLDRFYAAGWKCWLWLLLAVRLMIPFAPSFPGAPVYLNVNVNGSDAGVVQQILKNVQEGLQIRGETGQIHSENGRPEQENGQLLSKDVQPLQKNNLSDQKNGLPDQENGRQLSDNLQPDRENGSAPVQSITVWVNALLPLIWILGILIFSLYQFIKYHVYRKQIIRWSHGVRNPVISGKLEQLKKQMHIMGEISVLVSSRADSPMIIGLIRPALVLPYETYTDQELEFVLRHELTHYQRKDPWRKLFFLTVNAVHWFNPAVYLLFQAGDTDMERFCDDRVTEGADAAERKVYMETILMTAVQGRRRGSSLSTQMNGGAKILKQRFVNIMDRSRKRCGICMVIAVMVTCILSGGLVGCTNYAEAESPAKGTGMVSGGMDNYTENHTDSSGSSVLTEKEDLLTQELHIYFTDFYNMLLSDSRKEAERDDFTGINGYILEKQLVFTRESYNKSQGGICRVQLQEATVEKFTDNSTDENANGNGSMEGESVKAEVYVKYSFAWGDGSAQNRTSVGDLLKVTLTEHDGSYKILDLESTSVETQMVKEEIQSILEKHGEQAQESYDGVDRYFEDLLSSLL